MNFKTEEIWSDLVIVGGGPSAVIFLINMLKQGQLLTLFKGSGITILEKGRHFGSGRLEQYLINGYTNSLDLFRIILKEPYCYNKDLFKDYIKRDARGTQYIDTKSIDTVMEKLVLIGFKEVLMTNIYRELQKYGLTYPPLSAVGYFFRVVGNTLLRQIKHLKNQLIFRAYHEMQNINLQNDGCITLNVKINDPNGPSEQYYYFQQSPDSITPRQNRSIRPQVLDHYKKVRCKILLLCIGAKPQQVTYSALQQIPRGLAMHCDYFLTDKGFTTTMQIANKQRNKGNKKIVILGGNQNAFASAYLLLKGPFIYSQSEGRRSILQLNDQTITITQNSNYQQGSPSKYSHQNNINQIDSLSPFLHKRKIEQMTEQNAPCERCSILQTKRKRSVDQNQEDSNIFTINNNNINKSQLNIQQTSQFSSRFSTNTNAYVSQSLGNSYLAKRTGLSKAGMSILNLQNMNNNSTQGMNDYRMQARNYSQQPQQFNKSNNSFIFKNNLSSHNTNQQSNGYGSAFQSQFLLKNLENQQENKVQECLCLGSLKPLIFRWKKEDVGMIDLSNTEIIIIHQEDIRVYFQNVQLFYCIYLQRCKQFLKQENEAKLNGLWNENLSKLREKSGEINSQVGLKGDAKDLYLDVQFIENRQIQTQKIIQIQKGYETKVKLLQTNDEEKINEIIGESFMCIDASDYVNSSPLIKGVQGETYQAKKDSKNMLIIDSKQRLLTEKGPLKNIFCMGFFSGVELKDLNLGISQTSKEKVFNLNVYNEVESKRICSSVIDALQAQDSSEKWKWIEEANLSSSQIFNNQGEPDYESANIMNFFMKDDELGIDRINKQIRRAKLGLNFKGVDSYLSKKYKIPL
ncbi:hypothetical protein ABPG72_006433 [Tetrahymena utriculariae]